MFTPPKAPTFQNQCNDLVFLPKDYKRQLQKMNEMLFIYDYKLSRNLSKKLRLHVEKEMLKASSDRLLEEKRQLEAQISILEDLCGNVFFRNTVLMNVKGFYDSETTRLLQKKKNLELMSIGINKELEYIVKVSQSVSYQSEILCTQKIHFIKRIEYLKLKNDEEGVRQNENEITEIEGHENELGAKENQLLELIQCLKLKNKKADDCIKESIMKRLDEINLIKENIQKDGVLKKEETYFKKELEILKYQKDINENERLRLYDRRCTVDFQKMTVKRMMWSVKGKKEEQIDIKEKLLFEMKKKRKIENYIKYCWHF